MAAPAYRATSAKAGLTEGVTSIEAEVNTGATAGDCLCFMIHPGNAGPITAEGPTAVTAETEGPTEGWKVRAYVVPNWDGVSRKRKFTWPVSTFVYWQAFAVSGAHLTTPVAATSGGAVPTGTWQKTATKAKTVATTSYTPGAGMRAFVLWTEQFGHAAKEAIASYTAVQVISGACLWYLTAETGAGAVAAATAETQGASEDPQAIIGLAFQPPAAAATKSPPFAARTARINRNSLLRR